MGLDSTSRIGKNLVGQSVIGRLAMLQPYLQACSLPNLASLALLTVHQRAGLFVRASLRSVPLSRTSSHFPPRRAARCARGFNLPLTESPCQRATGSRVRLRASLAMDNSAGESFDSFAAAPTSRLGVPGSAAAFSAYPPCCSEAREERGKQCRLRTRMREERAAMIGGAA